MTTAIELLQVTGLFVATFFARAMLLVAAVLVLSLPFMAWAYGVRAIQEAWHHRHPHLPAAHHA